MMVKLAPVVFVCLWATGFIGARMGMPYAEPGVFLSIRFSIVVGLLVGISFIFHAPWPRKQEALQSILIGMLIHGFYLGGIFWAIDRGMPAGISAVVVGLQPLVTTFLAGWWLKEPITPSHLVSLALGSVGVFLVLLPKLDIANSGITAATIAVSFIAMLSISLGTVLQKKFATNIDLRTGTVFQYVGGLIPVFLLSLTLEIGEIQWSGELIFAMFWAVIVLSLFAVFLLMWLIREGSLTKVSSLFFMVPTVSSIMAYFLYDERLIPLQMFGMALCAIAVTLASHKIAPPVRNKAQ
ncbi:MAG: DMT family transporter [Rhizobiaceae bacterium]